MLTQEIIRKKRDGGELSADNIAQFVRGITDGSVSEGQAAALTMAIVFRGMTTKEIVAMTLNMRDSGRVMAWRDMDLDGPVVDKHSTGGIGDNVSIMLAPMLAACGCYVPMISGRSLGHTGGTLDKLESIPGYNAKPDDALFRKTVKRAGAAIIGQTADLAPADKRLYAIRDVTATVEAVPLFVSSILSKKLAAGLEALVLDVKRGSGAFMPPDDVALNLAQMLMDVANDAGLKTTALITDMDEPLASAAGNAVEIQNAVDYLSGKNREPRLHEVTLALGAELLMTTQLAADVDSARAMLEASLSSGKAMEKFQIMVSELGGPHNFAEKPENHLRKAEIIKPVPALESGYVSAIKTRDIGLAVIELGGGRRLAKDEIDHSVGYTQLLGKASQVEKGAPLAFVHAREEAMAQKAITNLQACYVIGDKPERSTPVLKRVTASR